jgi:hypothetical protein
MREVRLAYARGDLDVNYQRTVSYMRRWCFVQLAPRMQSPQSIPCRLQFGHSSTSVPRRRLESDSTWRARAKLCITAEISKPTVFTFAASMICLPRCCQSIEDYQNPKHHLTHKDFRKGFADTCNGTMYSTANIRKQRSKPRESKVTGQK